jgi:hypothetical protein
LPERRQEIEQLVRHVEERERKEHPMKRIMDLEASDEGMVVRTTDLHLARDFGTALERAYGGELKIDYAEDVVRVTWTP